MLTKRFDGAKLTDKGLVRNKNEDAAYFCLHDDFALAVVADGIGGHRRGEVASDTAISIISETVLHCEKEVNLSRGRKLLKHAIKNANKEINTLSLQEEYLDMGTTLVLGLVVEGKTIVANIGDSRLYTYSHKSGLKQISVDQTYCQYMVLSGKMTPEEARNSPKKNVLMNALGINPSVYYDEFIIENNYEALLLCSDGLYNMVPEEDIIKILDRKDLTAKEKAKELVDLANANGGVDNIGISLLEVQDESR